MKPYLLCLAALAAFAQSSPDMVSPQVKTETKQQTSEYTVTTRTCPAGYEGHFVDIQPGFSWEDGYWYSGDLILNGTPPSAYTICFKKEFMDKVRKDPKMVTVRPSPAHAL